MMLPVYVLYCYNILNALSLISDEHEQVKVEKGLSLLDQGGKRLDLCYADECDGMFVISENCRL